MRALTESRDGKAGFGKGNFYAEPVPEVKVYPPSRHWHAGKVLFEKGLAAALVLTKLRLINSLNPYH